MGWFPRLTPVRLSPQVPDHMTVSRRANDPIQVLATLMTVLLLFLPAHLLCAVSFFFLFFPGGGGVLQALAALEGGALAVLLGRVVQHFHTPLAWILIDFFL